jgi:uncharacterized membrane protein
VTHDEVVAKRGWQTHWHKHPAVRSGDQLTLGERAADRMRNVMGSWPFVFCFFAIMIIWALVNTVLFHRVLHHKAFDPYPYILLNLFLSMLAGVQAAALLIAAKRADAIASEVALHTERNTDDLKDLMAENTALTQQVKKNTDLLEEIHRHVTALTTAQLRRNTASTFRSCSSSERRAHQQPCRATSRVQHAYAGRVSYSFMWVSRSRRRAGRSENSSEAELARCVQA